VLVRAAGDEVKRFNVEGAEERRRTQRQLESTAEPRRAPREAEDKTTMGKLFGPRAFHYEWMN